jgi:hypothetical protein
MRFGGQLIRRMHSAALQLPLKQVDPEIFQIIEHEKMRQRQSVVLIPRYDEVF